MFLIKVGKMKTLDGELRFPSLFRLMAGLLTIPASNADSERGFSILRKIHTGQRPGLKLETIAALMSVKLNSEECCCDTHFTPEILSKCKKATVQSTPIACSIFTCTLHCNNTTCSRCGRGM